MFAKEVMIAYMMNLPSILIILRNLIDLFPIWAKLKDL